MALGDLLGCVVPTGRKIVRVPAVLDRPPDAVQINRQTLLAAPRDHLIEKLTLRLWRQVLVRRAVRVMIFWPRPTGAMHPTVTHSSTSYRQL